MSGRTRHLRDGVFVTNRKTNRRQGRPRPLRDRLHEIALRGDPLPGARVRLAFVLSRDFDALVAPGPHPHGIEVLSRGFVRVSSWSADQCFERAQAFFRDVAKDRRAVMSQFEI